MKRISIAAFALTAALSSVPALAGANSLTVSGLAPMGMGGYQVITVNVTYADLDITTSQGAAALLDRITAASRVACGERVVLVSGNRKREFAACQARTIAETVKGLNAPALTQVAAAR